MCEVIEGKASQEECARELGGRSGLKQSCDEEEVILPILISLYKGE